MTVFCCISPCIWCKSPGHGRKESGRAGRRRQPGGRAARLLVAATFAHDKNIVVSNRAETRRRAEDSTDSTARRANTVSVLVETTITPRNKGDFHEEKPFLRCIGICLSRNEKNLFNDRGSSLPCVRGKVPEDGKGQKTPACLTWPDSPCGRAPPCPPPQAGKRIYLLLLKNYACPDRQILMRRLRGKVSRSDGKGEEGNMENPRRTICTVFGSPPCFNPVCNGYKVKKYCRNEDW